MKFEEIVKYLRDGAQIRRENWVEGRFIYFDYEYDLVEQNGLQHSLILDDINSEDWEIYKEQTDNNIESFSLQEKILERLAKLEFNTEAHKHFIRDALLDIEAITDTNIKLSNRLFELENKIAQLMPDIR